MNNLTCTTTDAFWAADNADSVATYATAASDAAAWAANFASNAIYADKAVAILTAAAYAEAADEAAAHAVLASRKEEA